MLVLDIFDREGDNVLPAALKRFRYIQLQLASSPSLLPFPHMYTPHIHARARLDRSLKAKADNLFDLSERQRARLF